KDINAVDEAICKLDPDFGGFTLGRVDSLIEDILKEAMGDTDEQIGYFTCELQWGSAWKPGMITSKEGKDIPMGSLSELYDAIVLP
ncbi:MAG: hypothetical protein UV64_C0007G0001, partial [Parcubacteria group bacterium GW2011_GWC1_43_11b]